LCCKQQKSIKMPFKIPQNIAYIKILFQILLDFSGLPDHKPTIPHPRHEGEGSGAADAYHDHAGGEHEGR
jgi:hypothetical protein